MTIQRVPTTQAGRLMNANLQSTYSRLVDLQDQMASGKQLRRPSDAPAKVVDALDYRAQLRRSEQFERNSQDAQGWLQTADATLASVVSYVQRARDLTLQAANGSQNANGRQAAAAEIRSLRDGLVQLANTTYQGRSIFNGTAVGDTPAYDASGTYTGDGGTVMRSVAPGVQVQVNVTGPEVFGASAGGPSFGGNLFEVLTRLADDLAANDPSTAGTALTALDGALDRVYGVQASLGARSKRVDDVLARSAEVNVEIRGRLASIEDIDLPKTIIDVKTQELAYQAALQVTAKVIQPSLLDFLR